MTKRVNIVSDFQFDELAIDLNDGARAAAWEMWRDDLTTKLSKDQLLIGANSILYYFGSKVLLTDVAWCDDRHCFLWELEFDQPR